MSMNIRRKVLIKTWNLRICAFVFCLQGIAGLSAFGQSAKGFRPDRMDTIVYVVAYYPEYMPYDRLDQFVQLVQSAGITVGRIGDSIEGVCGPRGAQSA